MEVKEAIQKAKNNDQKAFKYLLNTYWDQVYGFQLKRVENENDAEDITIQTFSKAFDKIDTFNDNYTFSTWLITISKNIHIDIVRKEKHSIKQALTNLAQLLKDIKKLKLHYQEVINLRYFQELSYKDISEHLNEPINNVKVKLLRAKKLLAEIIQKQ